MSRPAHTELAMKAKGLLDKKRESEKILPAIVELSQCPESVPNGNENYIASSGCLIYFYFVTR